MSDLYKNPITTPQDDQYENREEDTQDFPTTIAGPGGRTSNIENNERGILDEVIFQAIGTYKQAELGSDHDSFAQGIYRSTDSRFGD